MTVGGILHGTVCCAAQASSKVALELLYIDGSVAAHMGSRL